MKQYGARTLRDNELRMGTIGPVIKFPCGEPDAFPCGELDSGIAKRSSRSDSRKAASAQIAKIPFPLAQHIARVFKP